MIYVALASFVGFSAPAAAQTSCVAMTLDQAIANVAKRHGEAPLFRGTMPGGEMFVVTAKQDGDRSWTVFIVPQDGIVCLPASGTEFRPMRDYKPAGTKS